MIYHHFIPQPPLSAFIDSLWLYQGNEFAHSREIRLPTASIELIINLREDKLRVYDLDNYSHFQSFGGSVVCGVHSKPFIIDTASQESIMGVHFKAGGASPFFKLPTNELLNIHLSSETLWGSKATRLRDQLIAARTTPARFHILEQALLGQLAWPLASHPAVAFALQEFQALTPHPPPIASVIKQTGLSQRRFIQVFNEEVGLTPKLFCRLQRFQAVLRLIGQRERVEWAEIALACGYYDQAHFIHDFQTFSSLNPTTYLIQRGEQLNHVSLAN